MQIEAGVPLFESTQQYIPFCDQCGEVFSTVANLRNRKRILWITYTLFATQLCTFNHREPCPTVYISV